MIESPASRRVRVLAFDPSLAARLETSTINALTVHIPWEDLQPGPVGEYIEVVDYEPAGGVFYQPVDMNHPHLLAQDGLPPSESNPQFHQQMVYAVAMTTIRQFERALGRTALWSDRAVAAGPNDRRAEQFVRRLRIYPHALRDRNAYYSPSLKALLFGFFPITAKDGHNTPGTIVYTCLSHDIIAHEVTHALLDGVHPRFHIPSNPDVHAFHEAFADIVALFQHFAYPAVLESQIRKTHGTLESENLLSQLAQQFGRATGRGGALRDALGGQDAAGNWIPRSPDPHVLDRTFEPHARGAILVAAVFRAFLLIYRARTADLFRIASGGLGRLPEGELHPDLTRRLAYEAAKSADRVLQMCIRAIDYCPPVDITFGDFLRGVITADIDYVPEDSAGYRTVFIQSFREWGIYPRGVTSLGIDALAWPNGDDLMQNLPEAGATRHDRGTLRRDMKRRFLRSAHGWNLESDRLEVWKSLESRRRQLRQWLRDGDSLGGDYARLFGLVIHDQDAPPTVYRDGDGPLVEVHAVRPAIRRTLLGSLRTDLVVEITQRRRGYFDPAEQAAKDQPGAAYAPDEHGDFDYWAGCTVLIDPATQEVRRIIRTPGTIADDAALDRVRRYRTSQPSPRGNAFDAGLPASRRGDRPAERYEPFALLHQMQDD